MVFPEKTYKTNGERIWKLIKEKEGMTATEISEIMGNYNKERIYGFLKKLTDSPIDKNTKLIRIQIERNQGNIHSKKIVNKYIIVEE